ncbi:HNH endonuclease, partial [Bordetella pseudohinzii]
MPKRPIHRSIKTALGYEENIRDSELLRDWNQRLEQICKPCWELKYCPYGPLVEEFPLLPVLRRKAEEHHAYLKNCLETKVLGDGRPLDDQRKQDFEERVSAFKAEEHPEEIPPILEEAACRVFGHVCPVFLIAEPLTETKTRRAHSRYISNEVMLKVVRRDGQVCQICHQAVPDNQVEFDHIIPFSRGGTTTAENLRLVHADCNREKGDVLDHILHPSPIEHL